jgi:hypothetical protein
MSRRRPRRGPATKPAEPAEVADSATPLDSLSPKQGWGLFLGLTGLIALIVFAPYLVGQKLYIFKDIGSDTINLFVPRWVHLASYLRETGIPGWSFNMGMGQNIFPNSLGGPFEMLLMLVGPEGLPYFLGWMEVLKITAAGCLMVTWLRLRGYDWVPCVYAGLGYAFCGSIIIGGGWYFFSTTAVYAALVPVGYELFRLRQRFLTFAIMVGVIASYSIFSLATMGVFGLVYFAFRTLAVKPDWKALGKETALLVGLTVLGMLMSAVFSMEAAAEILSSPRVAGEASHAASLSQTPMFALGDQRFYGTLILRTLSNDLLGTGSSFMGWYNYLEAPMNYSTLLALLLIPQVFVFLDKRRRIVFGIALGLLLGVQVFSYFRHLFWFFSGNYFRSLSTCISFAYLALAVRALQEISRNRRLNFPLLIGTATVLLIALLYPWSWAQQGKPMTVNGGLKGFCILIIVVEAGLLWALATGRNRLAAQAGLLGVVVLELLVFSYTPVNKRDVITAAEWKSEGFSDASVQALSKIREQDDGFYRVHKYYHSSPAIHASINDALIQDFYGTSSYYSFNQPNYLRFLAGAGVIDMRKEHESRWAQGARRNHALEVLTSVKYFLLKTNQGLDPFLEACPVLATVGDVRILENPSFRPLGTVFQFAVREADFASLPKNQKPLALLNALVLEDDVDPGSLTIQPAAEMVSPKVAVLPSLAMTEHGQNEIAGKVELSEAAVMMFSIPLDAGWSALVDGEPATIMRVNFGLMGLAIPAGNHTVQLRYRPSLQGIGLTLSVIGFLVLVGVFMRFRLNPQKKHAD